MEIRLVAEDHLRDSFVGLYDVDADGVVPQRDVLDVIGVSRTNGVTQSELAEKFNRKGNCIFNPIKVLECRGLIRRQSTIVRTRKETRVGVKNAPVVCTNLIHLYRYGKSLSSGQRVEITKSGTIENLANVVEDTLTDNSLGGGGVKDDVLVKDYLPALKSVCDELEDAEGNVKSVKAIKEKLGYKLREGHSKWRTILEKLKGVGIVEELEVEINKKAIPHLRLLQKFDPKNFLPKYLGCGYNDLDADQPVQFRDGGQMREQLLELPIEYQIYDMIDAAGSSGIPVVEVCKHLGINNKRNESWLKSMFEKYKMSLLDDIHNKTKIKRVWTSRNFNNSSTLLSNSKDILDRDEPSWPGERDLDLHTVSDSTLLHVDSSTSQDVEKLESERAGVELQKSFPEDGKRSETLIHGGNANILVNENRDTARDVKHCFLYIATKTDNSPKETPPPASAEPSTPQSVIEFSYVHLNIASAQRKQRILQLLKEENFILTIELNRRLGNLEKKKGTKMDRKTLTRTLNILQREGHRKCIKVSVPAAINCSTTRTVSVVLHKSIQGLPAKYLDLIHKKPRSSDAQSRGQGLVRSKNEKSDPVFNNNKRNLRSRTSHIKRAKLLPKFLGDYLGSSLNWVDALSSRKHGLDLNNPHTSCKMFALDAVIKAMPIELFLQVVRPKKKCENFKCGLCLSDLPDEEYNSLLDTRASGRLSRIVDILLQLKLIRLATNGDVAVTHFAVLTHALELKPYIEKPLSLGESSLDHCPRRYKFILSNREEVDKYWNTLENYYATVNAMATGSAFLGSTSQKAPGVSDYKGKIASRKRKKSVKSRAVKRVRPEATTIEVGRQMFTECHIEKRNCSGITGGHATCLRACDEENLGETAEEYRASDKDKKKSLCVISRLKSIRQSKFRWTDTLDRQLVIQYVRHRAYLGPRFNRTSWVSLPDLPAPPSMCRRRMTSLRRISSVRRAVTRLCNLLGERYSRHLLEFTEEKHLNHDGFGGIVQESSTVEGMDNTFSNILRKIIDCEEQHWDDFNDKNVILSLDEVFRCKLIAKLESLRAATATEKESQEVPQFTPLPGDNTQSFAGKRRCRSSFCSLSRKIFKHLDGDISVSREAHETLAVANDVELLKLVYLSSSIPTEVPNLAVETLRHYSRSLGAYIPTE
ncbi:hypothetical protein GIB67_034309, partial [Kingdonia uniflora]